MSEETRIVGDLPNLRVEILHRQDRDGMAEHVILHLTATPSLQAAESLLLGGLSPAVWTNPWTLWANMAQVLLAPWSNALTAANPWLPRSEGASSSKRD